MGIVETVVPDGYEMSDEEKKAYRLGVIDYMFAYISELETDERTPELVAYFDQLRAEQTYLREYFSRTEVDWRRRLREADEEMDILAEDDNDDENRQ